MAGAGAVNRLAAFTQAPCPVAGAGQDLPGDPPPPGHRSTSAIAFTVERGTPDRRSVGHRLRSWMSFTETAGRSPSYGCPSA